MFGRTELTLYPGMPGLPEGSFINTKAVSYTIDADLEIPDERRRRRDPRARPANSAAGASTSRTASRSTCYNWLAREKYEIEASEPSAHGQRPPHVRLRLRRRRTAQGRNRHRSLSTARRSARAASSKTMGALYSLAAEPADIGHDSYSPVTDDYDPWKNDFTGRSRRSP